MLVCLLHDVANFTQTEIYIYIYIYIYLAPLAEILDTVSMQVLFIFMDCTL